MTADDEASRAVWLGADGVLAGDLAAGAFAIECSTLSHDWVLKLRGGRPAWLALCRCARDGASERRGGWRADVVGWRGS